MPSNRISGVTKMEYTEAAEIWTKEFIPILEKWGFELNGYLHEKIVFVNGKDRTSFFNPTPQTVRSLYRKFLQKIVLEASGLNLNRYWNGGELDVGGKVVLFKFKLYKKSWEWEVVTDIVGTGMGTLEKELVKVKRPIDENPLKVLKMLVSSFLL